LLQIFDRDSSCMYDLRSEIYKGIGLGPDDGYSSTRSKFDKKIIKSFIPDEEFELYKEMVAKQRERTEQYKIEQKRKKEEEAAVKEAEKKKEEG